MDNRHTLLEVVTAVAEYCDTDDELVATVVHLVNSGAVRLCGNFRGARFQLDDVPLRRAS